MKSRITKTVALAALLAGAGGVAHATEGWYGRADVGYMFQGSSDFSHASSFTLDHRNDWMESGGLGYAFQNGFRLEGEISHRANRFDSGDLAHAGLVSGSEQVWAAMANVYYDFNRGGGVEPYVGLGAGYARIREHITASAGGGILDHDNTWAWQAMAGLAFQLTPQWDVDVGYRYFEAPAQSLVREFFLRPKAAAPETVMGIPR